MGKFQAGQPRLPNAGRKKGSLNKSTQSLFDKCKAKNIDVFEAMLEIASDPAHEDRAMMLKECAQYLYPKRKSLEHSGNISPEVLDASEQVTELSKEDQIKLLEQELKALKDGP